MKKGILVKYKGGLSKLTNCEEERLEFTPGISLALFLSKIFKLRSFSENKIVNIQSVLLTLNGTFIPPSESDRITLKEGDTISLFPTVSGG
jgi:thiamine biosynthesis protein ThiS